MSQMNVVRGSNAGTLVKVVESGTTKGLFYEVRMGKDGRLYCTCIGWKFHHDCKHARTIPAQLELGLG